jgi:predicted transcriptional regulator
MEIVSLKLSDELKVQVNNAAKALGMSPDAFMIAAIKQAIHNAEHRLAFLAQGYETRAQAIKTGKAYDTPEVHQHMRDRIHRIK